MCLRRFFLITLLWGNYFVLLGTKELELLPYDEVGFPAVGLVVG